MCIHTCEFVFEDRAAEGLLPGLPALSSLCIYQPFKCQSTGGSFFFTTHLITENITAEG